MMIKNKTGVTKTIAVFFLILVAGSFFSACEVEAGTNDKILFLHHSTGAGVWSGGDVPGWFSNYNSAHATSYNIAERAYPDVPYPWDNYPYDYWNLWVNGVCNSGNPSIECMNTMAQNYDIIIFKHCFPGADVLADTGSPDVSSSRKSLENYKLQYRALRAMMDGYPNRKFIVWTLTPLHRLATTADNAARARQFVDWVKNNFLSEDGNSHPNIFIFDFWGLIAGSDNFLKYEYEGSHTGSDSHPNALANQTVGPIFSQFIVDTANASTGPDTTPPTRYNGQPSGTLAMGTTQTSLSLSTNENATCRYATSANTPYDSMSHPFSTTGGTSHSTTVSGLSNGLSYTFYVRCQDGSGNPNTDDYPISFNISSTVLWNHVQTSTGTNSVSMNNTAGNLLVVEIGYTGTFTSLTDSRNTFSQVGTEQADGNSYKSRVYYASNIGAGSNTINASVTGGTVNEIYVSEYSGVNTLDVYSVHVANNNSSGNFTSNNLATTGTNELLWGYCWSSGNPPGNPSGWTSRSTFNGNQLSDLMAAAIGTYTYSGSTTGTINYIAWIAAFKRNTPTPPAAPTGLQVN